MTYWLEFVRAAGADARGKAVLGHDADRTLTARVILARTPSLCHTHTQHDTVRYLTERQLKTSMSTMEQNGRDGRNAHWPRHPCVRFSVSCR